MARTNVKQSVYQTKTHEGAPAIVDSPEKELRRAVLGCLLWEDTFYESGEEIAERIQKLAAKTDVFTVCKLAIEARTKFNLRHVPLLLLCAAAKLGAGTQNNPVAHAVEQVVQRADELGELLAVYAKLNKGKVRPLPAAFKRGLARAVTKFSGYSLGKYDRDNASVKLRDVLFLTHPKPKDEEQAGIWKKLVDKTLESPDTWEVALSGGADKKETFTRLLAEGKLGYLALLRNLRNMAQAGCDMGKVGDAIVARKNGAERVLPFRFVAAARACPQMERSLDKALVATIEAMEPLSGRTIVLVDVSGSMVGTKVSAKSDMDRLDAAATLASMIPGDVRVFTFDSSVREVPARLGMAGVEAIRRSGGGATYLGAAISHVNSLPHDRLIVLTDEQSHDQVPGPAASKAYMINVAGYRPSIAYGPWTRIEGFSEHVLRYIHEVEREGE